MFGNGDGLCLRTCSISFGYSVGSVLLLRSETCVVRMQEVICFQRISMSTIGRIIE